MSIDLDFITTRPMPFKALDKKTDYISREAAIKRFNFAVLDCLGMEPTIRAGDIIKALESIPAADVRPVPEGGIGEMSDGYHTFNGLYYQRMVLFAALVNAHNDRAWKSWKHEDGEPCFGGGWFIVGIDTPQGSYTYHYEGKYWNWFECQKLPVARHWDGHTEEDVTRLLSLPDVRPAVHGKWIDRDDKYYGWNMWACSACGEEFVLTEGTPDMNEYHFCPNCGADMREES